MTVTGVSLPITLGLPVMMW
ncbi:predicted protein [Streptomyces iranensis]|uniref:Uncharacterized protein n=1 Tax=Streptomyces iranensis TaxID=576784 RepID=A0A060ZN10_9ACTN|nr:predicted protein [Streptomyces iranensis]